MTAKNISLAFAKKYGDKRYQGQVCDKHPELAGERNARSRACIGCAREKMRARRAANPEYHRELTRLAHKKWYPKNREAVMAKSRERRTGIDQGTYLKLWDVQDGKCAICFSVLKQGAHADHCHDTKKPRGILCGDCNRAEGIIKRVGVEPEEFGQRLSEYLANPPANKIGKRHEQ